MGEKNVDRDEEVEETVNMEPTWMMTHRLNRGSENEEARSRKKNQVQLEKQKESVSKQHLTAMV